MDWSEIIDDLCEKCSALFVLCIKHRKTAARTLLFSPRDSARGAGEARWAFKELWKDFQNSREKYIESIFRDCFQNSREKWNEFKNPLFFPWCFFE